MKKALALILAAALSAPVCPINVREALKKVPGVASAKVWHEQVPADADAARSLLTCWG